jgi:hypothetical protein
MEEGEGDSVGSEIGFILGEADASELGSLEGGILGCSDGRLDETYPSNFTSTMKM